MKSLQYFNHPPKRPPSPILAPSSLRVLLQKQLPWVTSTSVVIGTSVGILPLRVMETGALEDEFQNVSKTMGPFSTQP